MIKLTELTYREEHYRTAEIVKEEQTIYLHHNLLTGKYEICCYVVERDLNISISGLSKEKAENLLNSPLDRIIDYFYEDGEVKDVH